jgi:biopolymer transport protein ExbB
MTTSELLDLMKLGGITMAVILAGSVLSIVIGFERMLFLRGFSARSVELHETVVKALLRGDVALASAECNRSQVATASIYRAALDRLAKPERIADAIDRARREVVQAMRGPLWMLATLGATMPFIGLFGTVFGILKSFRQMALAGTGGFAVVASGISEALVTTAAGIAVAVEAVILFNVFQTLVSREAFSLGLRCDEFSEVAQEAALTMQAARQEGQAP